MKKIKGYLRLMRPANIVTAIADILLGFAASGAYLYAIDITGHGDNITMLRGLGWLILSTIGLYGGGVVFNDVFDAELDRKERPERPIPSGLISIGVASILGVLLLLTGIISAIMVNHFSAAIALAIAILALIYDSYSKHKPFLGPFNMGLCRGGNVLLGVSIVPEMLPNLWFLALIPIIYIGAITMISQGEVHGGNKNKLKLALSLYSLVVFTIIALGLLPEYTIWHTIPFLFFFIYIVFPPLILAHKSPQPTYIRKAVKAGILALIVLDATIASGFAGWQLGVVIIILLPVSIFIGKKFAVT